MQQLLCVLFLGVILSCSMANQTISCPFADMPMHEIVNKLNKNLEICSLYHIPVENLEEYVNPPDEEAARISFRKYCNMTLTMEPCFAHYMPLAVACLDQHQLLGYKVNQENYRNGIQFTCSDLEERYAIITFRGKSISINERAACEEAFHFNDTATVDPATSSLRTYRAIKSYKQCIMDLIGDKKENLDLSESVSSLVTDVLKLMKCVANDNETVQSCESLDNVVT